VDSTVDYLTDKVREDERALALAEHKVEDLHENDSRAHGYRRKRGGIAGFFGDTKRVGPSAEDKANHAAVEAAKADLAASRAELADYMVDNQDFRHA
jgi:hypothetical protein